MRCALLLAVLVTAGAAAHDPITTSVTFSREVRGILAARCVTCHAPGGSAPMPLTTYDETRPWARAIKEQILTRRMPKWQAARGFGAFAHDPTLTPFEIALLVSWIDGGLPRDAQALPGANPAAQSRAQRAPPLSRPASSFPKRKTDIVLTVPAGAAEVTSRVGVRWIGGWSFQPGDPLITSATFSESDGTVIGNWVAGDPPVLLPANSGVRLSG